MKESVLSFKEKQHNIGLLTSNCPQVLKPLWDWHA